MPFAFCTREKHWYARRAAVVPPSPVASGSSTAHWSLSPVQSEARSPWRRAPFQPAMYLHLASADAAAPACSSQPDPVAHCLIRTSRLPPTATQSR